MKMNFIVILLVLTVALFSGFNVYYSSKFNEFEEVVKIERETLSNEIGYLKNSVEIGTSIPDIVLPVSNDKDIVIYYSNVVCTSCMEKLLIMIDKEYDLLNRLHIVTDDSSSIGLIESLNDAFQLNYEVSVMSEDGFPLYFDPLVFKVESGNIQSVLEFSLDTEPFFKKYFDDLYIQ